MIRTLWFRPARAAPRAAAIAAYEEARALAGVSVVGVAASAGAPSFGRATLVAVGVLPAREERVADVMLAGGWEPVCPHCGLGTLDRRWSERAQAYRLAERCERCEAIADVEAREAAEDDDDHSVWIGHAGAWS